MATRAYRFHPLERRGVVVGLGPGQLLTLGVGVVTALVVLASTHRAAGVLGAAVVLVASAAAALWPVAGRTTVGWLPVVAAWVAARRRVDLAGVRAGTVPPGITLAELPAGPGETALGVVRDRTAGTWAAVLPLSDRAFTLLDDDDKERRLGSWRAVLAAAGRPGSPLQRIQWIERTIAADAEPLRRYLQDAPPVAGLPDEVVRSYRDLLERSGGTGERHEVLLVLAVHPRRRGRSLRAPGEQIGVVLRRELRLLQGQLRGADVRVGAPLDRDELVAAIRTGFAPDSRQGRGTGAPWPMAAAEGWGAARADGRWLATYWVAEWPRIDVGPEFLVPLLLSGGARAVSLTMAPVPTAKAIREVESARTADAADDELRRRAGFLTTARHRRQAEGALDREAELAEGHVEFRFSGYVTVSGATVDELDQRCAEVEQAAQQCHLDLRRLWGQQRDALAWTLPLARGLR